MSTTTEKEPVTIDSAIESRAAGVARVSERGTEEEFHVGVMMAQMLDVLVRYRADKEQREFRARMGVHRP